MEEVVCPPKLRQRLFTTGAVDNIDHNPSSATAKDSFHGMGISLMQHPSHTNDGLNRGVVVIGPDMSSAKSVTPLPLEYTSVPPAAIKTHHFTSSAVQGPARPQDLLAVDTAVQDEYVWLRTVKTALEKQSIDQWVSWSAYNADIQKTVRPPAAINALLPLFVDSAHSVAMIKHSMTIVKAAIQHLNPGQVPVLAADQPLFALAKEIQWTWPATHGEDHFVIMFGGLHIEMGVLKTVQTRLYCCPNCKRLHSRISRGELKQFIEMARVTNNPDICLFYRLLDEAYHVKSKVIQWSADEVDACLNKLAAPVSLVPNKKALKKKLQKMETKTFYDGVPVILREEGTSNILLVREDIVEENVRYLTFVRFSWPDEAPVSPSVLAKAGFYYFGIDDTVQCFSCNGRIKNWAPGDTAMGEHRRIYPRCEFVRGSDTKNIPARGLVNESSKGAEGGKFPGPGPPAPSSDEAGCTENSLEYLVKSLKLEETEPEPLPPSESSYFKNESNRLLTFKHWPLFSPVDKFDLAAAGFYCVNESTGVVQCFACFGRLSEWKLGDRPKVEHKRKFPSCPFVSGRDTENKPLTQSQKGFAVRFFAENPSFKQPQQISANLPEVGRYASSSESSAATGCTVHPLTVATSHDPQDLTVKYAKYPQRAYEQARLETYKRWPRNHSQIPANLARTGFFATGNEDEVKCFYCGGGLKDWAEEDDPWEEHARWFSRCEWLLQQRGPGFVDAVKRKYGPSEPYFEPNQGIPSNLPLASRPSPTEEIRIPPHQFTVTSMAAEPEPRRTTPQRRPETRQSEPKKKESRKQPAKKKQQEKKKQGKKNRPLDEKVEEQLHTDMVKFMLEMGQEEAIIRSVLRKRFQSGQNAFESSEQLLNAIFEEEELQKKGASNAEPHMPNPPEAERQSEYEPLRGSLDSMSAAENTSPEHSRVDPEQEQESDFKPDQDFVEVLDQLSQFLRRSDTDHLCTYFTLTPREQNNIMQNMNPAHALMMLLYERGTIKPDDVLFLSEGLKELNLNHAAGKLDSLLHSVKKDEQQSGDLQSEEIEKLREKNLCKICLDQNVEMLFLPCQHLVTCADCASRIDVCPICRGSIAEKIYVYMP